MSQEISDPLCDQQLIPRSHSAIPSSFSDPAVAGETKNDRNLDFHTIRSPKTNQEQEHDATSRREQDFERTNRSENDHEAPRVYERTIGSYMVLTMAMMMMMISTTFNLQLVRGHRIRESYSTSRLNKTLVISLRPSPHGDGRPV